MFICSTRTFIILAAMLFLGACATGDIASPDPRAEVADVERAFARTMADRDHAAFRQLLSSEAVFLSGGTTLTGKEAIAEAWARYFDGAEAPFSWAPETVEVLDSGQLAMSTGPVWNRGGERIATFTSIWRREKGQWRIIFDRGNRYCPPDAP